MTKDELVKLAAAKAEAYPILPAEKRHSEVSLARSALRAGFDAGYRAALRATTTGEAK